ncbi:hypothetical protein WNY61_07860 [Sulfitobacter sp. AS92]|uniref:hypothetical protein n=1 Tax=Sulfitobacter sp. AS92 TaxID=3135783 RepID=UPI003172DB21
MVSKTKSRNRIIARSFTRTPVTLQQVHDHEPDPRFQSALRRLSSVLDDSLKAMPADIGWFDAHFPKDRLDGAKAHWSSAQAYNRWRNTIRGTIRQRAAGCGTLSVPLSPLRVRHLVVTKAHIRPSPPASQIHGHGDISEVRAYCAHFRKAASGPKSD